MKTTKCRKTFGSPGIYDTELLRYNFRDQTTETQNSSIHIHSRLSLVNLSEFLLALWKQKVDYCVSMYWK